MSFGASPLLQAPLPVSNFPNGISNLFGIWNLRFGAFFYFQCFPDHPTDERHIRPINEMIARMGIDLLHRFGGHLLEEVHLFRKDQFVRCPLDEVGGYPEGGPLGKEQFQVLLEGDQLLVADAKGRRGDQMEEGEVEEFPPADTHLQFGIEGWGHMHHGGHPVGIVEGQLLGQGAAIGVPDHHKPSAGPTVHHGPHHQALASQGGQGLAKVRLAKPGPVGSQQEVSLQAGIVEVGFAGIPGARGSMQEQQGRPTGGIPAHHRVERTITNLHRPRLQGGQPQALPFMVHLVQIALEIQDPRPGDQQQQAQDDHEEESGESEDTAQHK